MNEKYQFQHISIELLRTTVTIAEVGTFTKAGKLLGLSQPAITAQVKKLENTLCGSIFERSSGGTHLSDAGRLIVAQARKVLEAHDQLFRITGCDATPQRIRLGLGTLFVRSLMSSHQFKRAEIYIQSDESAGVARDLIDGHLDVACFFLLRDLDPDIKQYVMKEADDELVWVKAKDFVAIPGAPIPIVTWNGHDWITRALMNHGLSYEVVFHGQDYDAKRAVVEAGQGISALPSRMIPNTLCQATESYLPKLPNIKTVLCVRSSEMKIKASTVINRLTNLFFETTPDVETMPDVLRA